MIVVISCLEKNTENNNQQEKIKYNMPNTTNDTYNPGVGWTLDWADEFDTDTINSDNWTYQIEKVGRFNEEWQRYTNSIENAYIENNQLVIKAIPKTTT